MMMLVAFGADVPQGVELADSNTCMGTILSLMREKRAFTVINRRSPAAARGRWNLQGVADARNTVFRDAGFIISREPMELADAQRWLDSVQP
jgi:hypothetical protein